MSSCLRPSVWLLAVLAAWCIQGGAARAGYVTIAASGGDEAGHTLSSAMTLIEGGAGSGMAGGDSSWQRPNRGQPHIPTTPGCPLAQLPTLPFTFGHSSGAGSSSSSGSGNGPSSPPAGVVARPQVPPLEVASLLPPQKGDAHPFSVASFLFRPPRAA